MCSTPAETVIIYLLIDQPDYRLANSPQDKETLDK